MADHAAAAVVADQRPPTPPRNLPDDIIESILLALPSEPGYLAVASAASRTLRCRIHDDAGFLRAFRAAHGDVPPLVGVFGNAYHGDEGAAFFTRAVAASGGGGLVADLAPPAGTVSDEGQPPHVCDCRHGRVLLFAEDANGEDQFIVWEPLTGAEHRLPAPPTFDPEEVYGAALVCDAAHVNGGDCHGAAERPRFWTGPPDNDNTYAFVYTSATRTWSDMSTMAYGCDFDFKPSAVVGGAVYWLGGHGGYIIELELETKELALYDTPDDFDDIVLLTTADGKVGFAGVVGDTNVAIISLEIRNDHGVLTDVWTVHTVIEFDNWGFLSTPEVIGFVGEANSVLVQIENGVLMIDIDTRCHRRVLETGNFSTVYPYSSFYTAVGKAVFEDEMPHAYDGNQTEGGAAHAASDGDEQWWLSFVGC